MLHDVENAIDVWKSSLNNNIAENKRTSKETKKKG